jgi:hypothetical protein
VKVEADKSRFHEIDTARNEFNRAELRRLRLILRRLRFLEAQVEKNGGLASSTGNGGAGWAEWEVEALEWILDEVGFLETRERKART